MGSAESHLEVINDTNRDITNTSVHGCDNFDWHGNARPDRNFQGRKIPAKGGSICEREVMHAPASNCPFIMVLTFSDGTVDEFRIHQKHAIGCCAGFNHIRRSHDIDFSVWGRKMIIKVHNTHQQLQNEKAEERNREGEAAMRQQQYDAAMQKFDEALSLANQGSLINSIKYNKSQAYTQSALVKSQAYTKLAQASLQEAWASEADVTQDRSKEAQDKFAKAQNLFQQAQNLHNTADNQKNLNLVTLKINGNRLFNEANNLEKEAFKLFENAQNSKSSDDYTKAEGTYKAAHAKYEEAVKEFEEGAKIDKAKFEDSIKIAGDLMKEVQKVIEDIDKAELNDSLVKVKIDEKKKGDKEQEKGIDVTFQEQVDVVTN